MSEIHNYYIAHLRRGMAARVKDADLSGSGKRVQLDVQFTAGYNGDSANKNIPMALYGSGDVLGFNEKMVVKTEPLHQVNNFRADLIPYIEFAEPDFLWRYSTAKENGKKYWIPWLTLIVLKPKVEFNYDTNPNPKLPPTITLENGAVLPDLKESWRWAHIHLNEAEGLGREAVAQILKQAPHKAVSRLMCPRRLKTDTSYAAFVVPTYKLGVQAALGQDLTAGISDLAWSDASGQKIPYYYSWEFESGQRGDFEFLVKQLKPNPIKGVGQREIDAGNPGYGMKKDGRTVKMEGALQSVEVTRADPAADLQSGLINLINPDGQLKVVPPVYGRWYVSEEGADYKLASNSKKWVDELNLDLRHRAVAGLGVQFVKDQQEALMESAWKQLAEIQKANQAANLARFGRAVSNSMFKRVAGLDTGGEAESRSARRKTPSASGGLGKLFQIGLAMRKRINSKTGDGRDEPETIDETLQKSTLSHPVRRLKTQKYLRKYRPLAEKTSINRSKSPVNEKEYLVPPTFVMRGLVDVEREEVTPYKFNNTVLESISGGVAGQIDPVMNIENRLREQLEPFRDRAHKTENVFYKKKKEATRARQSGGEAVKDKLRDVVWYPEFHSPMYRYLRDKSQELLAPGLGEVPQNTVSLLQTNPHFIESFMTGLNHEFASELRWREFPTDMRGSYFRKFWDTTIYSVDDVEKTAFRSTAIGKSLLEKIKIAYPGPSYNTMAAIEGVFDKVGALSAQEKAIALAYEEAVERWLLSREEDKDIDHFHDWLANSRLGTHIKERGPQEADNQIVLLIRGELLQLYPNAIVYLCRKNQQGKPDFEKREFPIFEGHLPPDVLFLGFPISADQAADFFAVFEEPMSEIKYGLDESETPNPSDGWNDASWQHFSGLVAGGYLDGLPPNLNVNNDHKWDNPAFIAQVFTQHSVRLAVPLTSLIPD